MRQFMWRTVGFTFIRQRYQPDFWTIHFHGRTHLDEETGEYVATGFAPVYLSHQIWPAGSGHHDVHLKLWRLSIRWGK